MKGLMFVCFIGSLVCAGVNYGLSAFMLYHGLEYGPVDMIFDLAVFPALIYFQYRMWRETDDY